jgi:hypothetical protein
MHFSQPPAGMVGQSVSGDHLEATGRINSRCFRHWRIGLRRDANIRRRWQADARALIRNDERGAYYALNA